MRFLKLFLAFGLWFSAGCEHDSKSQTAVNLPDQNNSAANTNVTANISENDSAAAAIRENQRIAKELDARNEPFKIVPDEFRNVDFKNFTYPTEYPKGSVTLKDGELEYEIKEDGGLGGGWFNLINVYFVDLTGDAVKEAFVILGRVDCGGSCDGGSELLYVYNLKNQKPNLLWRLELGSGAYDCGLKSLTVREKKINFEVFDNCFEKEKKLEMEANHNGGGKFSSNGLTEFVYSFDGKTFVRDKYQFGQPQAFRHQNYLPPISISD